MSHLHALQAIGRSRGTLPQALTLRPERGGRMPKSAVKLTPTVWFMPKGRNNDAQAFTLHAGRAYGCFASEWNPSTMIEPSLEVVS